MISQLLFLSRADQGRQPHPPGAARLKRTDGNDRGGAADAGRRRGPRHPDRKPDQPGVEADADETLYIRMVSNLLSNAVRYSHDGGKVEVILEERDGKSAAG